MITDRQVWYYWSMFVITICSTSYSWGSYTMPHRMQDMKYHFINWPLTKHQHFTVDFPCCSSSTPTSKSYSLKGCAPSSIHALQPCFPLAEKKDRFPIPINQIHSLSLHHHGTVNKGWWQPRGFPFLAVTLCVCAWSFTSVMSNPLLSHGLNEARQAPLFTGLSRQGYWSGLLCPSPGDLPNWGLKPTSPTGRWVLYCWALREAPNIKQ